MLASHKIPWPRILAEGVAIVVSILLAFGIEAWWSNREFRLTVQENLIALTNEINSNLREIDHELTFRLAVNASIENLSAPNANVDTLSPEEVDRLIGDLFWTGQCQCSIGALESILQSSVFIGVGSAQLRGLLAGLAALYDDFAQAELRNADFTENRLYDFINANGSYNQITNLMGSGRPGTGEAPFENHYRVSVPRDHSTLLESEQFLGLLTMAHAFQGDVVLYYERIKSSMERTIALIELQTS